MGTHIKMLLVGLGGVLVAFTCLINPSACLATKCSSWKSCPGQDVYCFVDKCLTAQQFMEERFALGTSCTAVEDCPELCRTSLSKPTCGPYTRSGRIPVQNIAEPECSTDSDCQGKGEQCFPRQMSTQCLTPQYYAELEFAIGRVCSTDEDCPESCWKTGTCGPYL